MSTPPSRTGDEFPQTGSAVSSELRQILAALPLLASLLLAALGAPSGASADALELGPFAVSDIFETPTCSPSCTTGDFPQSWGTLRTFTYALTPGDQVTDILIEGVWGGTNPWSAPVEVYLEGTLVATCTASDVCTTDPTGRVVWNGGPGFLLSSLGVNFSDAGVRALFEDDDATLSVIQTGTSSQDSVDLSSLQITVHVERTCEAELCDGFDNDCDLAIDNGVADIITGSNVGECQTGIESCIAGSFQVTQAEILPAAETCNGLDDDCDSVDDNGVADIITGSDVGECQTEIQSCVAGSFQITQTEILPATETCNGLDDDCDSVDDNGVADIITGSDVGECQTEIQSCVAGSFQITQAEILPATETCNGLDDDCNSVDDNGVADIITGSDVGECQTEIQSCVAGSFQITQTEILPATETCNGLDDDCDSVDDNGVADVITGSNVGECQTGIESCIAGSFQITQTEILPATETCNGLDDDCDSVDDNGVADVITGSNVGECQTGIESCIAGSFQITQTEILPATETCNGLDDDCDSVDDNGVADVVTGSDVGECQTEIQSCIGGSFQITQSGIIPTAEICNGLDDDCDTIPDNSVPPIVSGSDVGECQTEIQSCIGGSFQVTRAEILPATETCNGLDDDCDSVDDNGVADIITGSDVGECQTEIQSCIAGSFQVTQAEILPATETCNGLDDDCDSVDDNGVADVVTGSDVGACQTEIQSCIGGSFQITQTEITPTNEICNGFDDDCDSVDDNGVANIVTGSDVGECQTEIQSCIGGSFQLTQTGISPTNETCNGLDDDCNSVDDNDIADIITGLDVGECQTEIQSCIAGSFQVTQAEILPAAETCNGLDDDCDSVDDNGVADVVTGSDVGECQTEIQSCIGGSLQITQAGITPATETCNGLDDNCNGLDDDGISNIVTGSDVGECQTEIQTCIGSSFQITQAGIGPATEICNGLDDDCDSVNDNDIGDIATGSDVGECRTEIQSCLGGSFQVTQTEIGPVAETCNGLDDDCNTAEDDGIANIVTGSDTGECQTEIQSCIGGSFQITQPGILPVTETCNGLDDDCNAAEDDGIANIVTGSDIGECQTEIQSCIGGSFQITQAAIGPASEICNGLDDDCDTEADDNIADIVTSSDVGECQAEIQSCIDGSFQIVQPAVGPAPEVCNGLNDDCDDETDEDVADLVNGSDIGECQTEIQSCIEGSFQITQAAIGPASEICNGLDDDCDTEADDNIADTVTGSDVGECQTEIQSCAGGSFQIIQTGVLPATEICNGLDDDCNSVNDNDIANIITGSDVGECRTEIQSCNGGSFQIIQTGIAPATETCNGLDDDCDSANDNDIANIITGSDVGECQTEIQSCLEGSFQITQAGIGPVTETCNGLDDDCDSANDNDIANIITGSDVGECQTEIQSCLEGSFQITQASVEPTTEICNGLDDDCNSLDDDGIANIVTGSNIGECQTEIQVCRRGAFRLTQAAIEPVEEICNGLDDDCNATPDDGIDPIASGSTVGECQSEIQECIDGSFQVTQVGIEPTEEICNGLDDDCDAIPDDGIDPVASGSPVGECRPEIQTCLGGRFQVTQTQITAATEVCNNLDDDCDSVTDNGIADIASGSNVGECREEIQSCIGGAFEVTQVPLGPIEEICNGLDDDCNGSTDNGFGPISCGTGVCATTVDSCVDGGPQVCEPLEGPGQEFCMDGQDDDCDGFVDDTDICDLEGFDSWAEDVELTQVFDQNLVLVAAQSGGLRLLEFSDLGPRQVGFFDPNTCKNGFDTVDAAVDDVDVDASGDVAYLAAGPCGFWTVAVSDDISSPTWLASFDTPGWVLDVEAVDEEQLLYVADHNGGLAIFDVSVPSSPQVLGLAGFRNTGFGAAIDVVVLDGIAYVATTRGLRVVDSRDREDPFVIGTFDTNSSTGPGQDVEVVDLGDQVIAYLSAWLDGVFILDVTDPADPQLIAQIPSQIPDVTAIYELTVAGKRAFLAEGSTELRIFDVSDPSDPIELDSFEARGLAWDVEVKDGVAYVGFGEDSFGATPGVEAVHVTTMGLQLADVGAVPEPTHARLAAAALGTLLWLRSRRGTRRVQTR